MVGLLKALIFRNRPLYVHYGITHRCNLSCRMCTTYQDADAHQELSLEQIDQAFDFLKRMGVVYVSIGGGEPLLRADLPDVVQMLRTKGLMVRLLTNGLLADEKLVTSLAAKGLIEVSVSLDSLDPEKQAYICNSPDSWSKAIRGLELFAEILPKRGRCLLINTVVSKLNIKELPALCDFAQSRGYFISFIPVESDGCGEFSFTPDDYHRIDQSYDYLIKKKKAAHSAIFNSSLFLEKSRSYLKSGKHNWECDAGRLYLSLNPGGEFSICHRFKPEASLLEAKFKTLSDLPGFPDRRKQLIESCPGCLRPCWAELSFLFQDRRSFWEMAKLRMFGCRY